MSKQLRPLSAWVAATLALAVATPTVATDVARIALQSEGLAKPNVIFGMDDSGSMDFEVLLSTNDGALWWNSTSKTAWDASGDPLFETTLKYTYLFPNGCDTSGRKHLCSNSGSPRHYAVPPTAQFAALRSSEFNPLYYDSNATYAPWAPASVAGVSKTFTDANPAAALSHPLFSTTGMALTTVQSSLTAEYTFHLRAGMVAPKGSTLNASSNTSGACSGSQQRTLTADVVVGSGSCEANIPYYPATFWARAACTVDNLTCAAIPGGGTLKRYEIKSGVTFPSGRTYAAELQNFANWFTYHRKRKLMLAGSMGTVLDSLKGVKLGVVAFNNRVAPTMFDADSLTASTGSAAVVGLFYGNKASGGTPTRETLNFIGNQFSSNKNIVQYSCRRNAAFMVTDGFANAGNVTPPAYSKTTYGSGSPYAATANGSLADIALSYYTTNIRTDLPAGRVPAATASNPNPAADRNANPHMNTYAITLGASGTIWPARTDAYSGPITWPDASESGDPASIDDLWHATINGRGKMFRATKPAETAAGLQEALTEILKLSGAQGGVTFNSPNIGTGQAVGYVGIYRPLGWSGDVAAYRVNAQTGALASTAMWSADQKLSAKPWGSRQIATFKNGSGVAFTAANVGGAVNPGNTYGVSSEVVDYLRGNRTLEGTKFRVRTGLMGGVINAEPAASRREGAVFAATNEGMVHAFDSATGEELWAYVPGAALASIGAQTAKTWTFETLLDGSPVVAEVDGKSLLVGGLGTAGRGYYALDVTGAKALNEDGLAERVKWEFPSASASSTLRSAVGQSMGKPLVVRTARFGWVVLVTSGYNSTLDGKGRVFVLNANTGEVLLEMATSAGTTGSGDAGLAQLSGFLEADGSVRKVYGGDLLGNVWRFDIATGAVSLLTTLTSESDTPLPLATAPELALVNGRRMVYVGAGKVLGQSDFDDTTRYSFFGIWDDETPLVNPRSKLAVRTLTTTGGVSHATGAPINWANQRGGFVDLPAGEKANVEPAIAYGAVTWVTNKPSATSCSTVSSLYVADAATGLALPASQLDGDGFYGREIGSTMASRPSLTKDAAGRVVVTTQQSDAMTRRHEFSILPQTAPRRLGWKLVQR